MPGQPGRKAFPEPGMRLVRLACSAQGRGPSGAAHPDPPHSPALQHLLGLPLTSNTRHRQRLTLKWIPFQRSPGKKVTSPVAGSQPTYYLRKHLVSSSLNNKVPRNSQTTTSHPLSPDIHSHWHKHVSTLLFPTLQPQRKVVPN